MCVRRFFKTHNPNKNNPQNRACNQERTSKCADPTEHNSFRLDAYLHVFLGKIHITTSDHMRNSTCANQAMSQLSCKTRNSKRRMRHCVQTRSSTCANLVTEQFTQQDAQLHVYKPIHQPQRLSRRGISRVQSKIHVETRRATPPAQMCKTVPPIRSANSSFSKHDTSDQMRNFAWATV